MYMVEIFTMWTSKIYLKENNDKFNNEIRKIVLYKKQTNKQEIQTSLNNI